MTTPPGSRPPSPRPQPPTELHRQVLIRRAIASGAFILILVLLLFGIRGCLDARQDRGFENYASDVAAISAETASISEAFFKRLSGSGELSPLELEAEIQSDRGAIAGLLVRAQGLEPPGELADAHREVELSYELRTEALAGFSESAPLAIGDPSSKEFISRLTAEMKALAAADVLDARGAEAIAAELEAQELDPPEDLGSQFLPEVPDWLSDAEVKKAVEKFSQPDEPSGTTGTQGRSGRE